jgi:hypothetical protein
MSLLEINEAMNQAFMFQMLCDCMYRYRFFNFLCVSHRESPTLIPAPDIPQLMLTWLLTVLYYNLQCAIYFLVALLFFRL